MKRWLLSAIALAAPARAHAEVPRWSVGWRTSVSNQLLPPPWLINGGQWRFRPRPWLSFAWDFDGGRGRHHTEHDPLDPGLIGTARTLGKTGLAIELHPHRALTIDTRVFAGGGVAVELTHLQLVGFDDWVHDGTRVRPMAFAGGAIEWVHELLPRNGVGFGIDVRGLWLGGDGPPSSAPGLPRLGVQATLELNLYLGRPVNRTTPPRAGERYTAAR